DPAVGSGGTRFGRRAFFGEHVVVRIGAVEVIDDDPLRLLVGMRDEVVGAFSADGVLAEAAGIATDAMGRRDGGRHGVVASLREIERHDRYAKVRWTSEPNGG